MGKHYEYTLDLQLREAIHGANRMRAIAHIDQNGIPDAWSMWEVIDECIIIKWVGYDDGGTYIDITNINTIPTSTYGECLI